MSEPTTDDMRKAVEGWLRHQGFPFELQVARVLLEQGFGLRQGWHFADPEGDEKPRELDMLAYIHNAAGRPVTLQVPIECKWTSQPFVVFRYPTAALGQSTLALHQGNPAGRALLGRLANSPRLARLPLFARPEVYGYAAVQARLARGDRPAAGADGKDDAYEALMKVSKALYRIVEHFTERPEMKAQPGTRTQHAVATVVFPTVVVSGPLFLCGLNAANEAEVSEVPRAYLTWTYPPVGTFAVRIVTLAALEGYLEEVIETARNIDTPGG